MALWNEPAFHELEHRLPQDVPADAPYDLGVWLNPAREEVELYLNGMRLPRSSWTLVDSQTVRFGFDLKAGDHVLIRRMVIW